ncbi:hypothetical protein B1218_35615, partial [Pseudomonas ogarae]
GSASGLVGIPVSGVTQHQAVFAGRLGVEGRACEKQAQGRRVNGASGEQAHAGECQDMSAQRRGAEGVALECQVSLEPLLAVAPVLLAIADVRVLDQASPVLVDSAWQGRRNAPLIIHPKWT